MSRFYAYGRVSHQDSADSNISIPTQVEESIAYFESLPDAGHYWAKARWPNNEHPGFFIDRAMSAFRDKKTAPLDQRPAGGYLCRMLEPGDQVIFWKLDRAWRSVYEFSKTVPAWLRRGIGVHFVRDGIDLTTANGRMLANVLAAFAEWKSDMISERTREGLAARSAAKKPPAEAKASWSPSQYAARKVVAPTVIELAGRVFSYGRCSHADSAVSGKGLASQQIIADKYAHFLVRLNRGLVRDRHLVDVEVSAFKIPLRERPEGRILDGLLGAGDHVVVARLDRAWRDVADMLATIDSWESRGITVHFADLRLDLSNPASRLYLTLMAAMAEWESRDVSHRTKLAHAACKAAGRAVNQEVPCGFRVIKHGGVKRFVPDLKQLAIIRWIAFLRDHRKLTFVAIGDTIEKLLAKRENRKPIPRGGRELPRRAGLQRRGTRRFKVHMETRPWTVDRVKSSYHRWPKLKAMIAEWRAAG